MSRAVRIPPREVHLHECGHWDDCYLSAGDAAGSDCRSCRADKFNHAAAKRASQAPGLSERAGLVESRASAGLSRSTRHRPGEPHLSGAPLAQSDTMPRPGTYRACQ